MQAGIYVNLCKPSTPKPETALDRPPMLFPVLGRLNPQPQSPNGKNPEPESGAASPKGSFFRGRDITLEWVFLGG